MEEISAQLVLGKREGDGEVSSIDEREKGGERGDGGLATRNLARERRSKSEKTLGEVESEERRLKSTSDKTEVENCL